MNRYLSTVANDRGTALLIVVVLVPVLTLFCIFASNVSVQDTLATANDNCHRYAIYDADAAIYATSKLISLVAKDILRTPVQEGEGNQAPGVEYLNSSSDRARSFVDLVAGPDSANTAQDVKFVKTSPDSGDPMTEVPADAEENDFGIGSTVDITKDWGRNVEGGGAEFANASGGVGTKITKVRYRLNASSVDDKGNSVGSVCPGTRVQVNGDYWLFVAGDVKKGI